MREVKPLYDKILVDRLDAPEIVEGSKAGLAIPDVAQEKPLEGVVIAVGSGRRDNLGNRMVPDVEVGNHVLFPKYAGSEIMVDGVEKLIMREEEILAIISEKANE